MQNGVTTRSRRVYTAGRTSMILDTMTLTILAWFSIPSIFMMRWMAAFCSLRLYSSIFWTVCEKQMRIVSVNQRSTGGVPFFSP